MEQDTGALQPFFRRTSPSWAREPAVYGLRVQKIPGNNRALNLTCPLINRNDPGVAVHALDFRFAGIAEGTVDLDGFVDNTVDHFTAIEFGAGGVTRGS